MRVAVFAGFLVLITNVWAQSAPAVPKSCAGLAKHVQALKSGGGNNSFDALTKLQSRGETCLTDLFAQLPPDQQAAAQTVFKLYQAADSQLIQQVRERDVAESRAQLEREMRDGGAQMASLFGRLSEVSYRYNQLLDQANQYLVAEDKFHKSVTPKTAGVSPTPISLPDKIEFLDCSNYHVGRFSACWPPDD
jgi:hypothetical protein